MIGAGFSIAEIDSMRENLDIVTMARIEQSVQNEKYIELLTNKAMIAEAVIIGNRFKFRSATKEIGKIYRAIRKVLGFEDDAKTKRRNLAEQFRRQRRG